MIERQVEIELYGFQEEFVGLGISPPITNLFLYAHPGRGAGKTTGGGIQMLSYMCKFPNSVGLITVPKYDTWTDSTYPAIREVFKWAGWRAGEDWTYVENKKQLFFYPTNCIAFIRSTDEPESRAGPTVGFIWMDEPRLSPENAFATLVGSLRQGGRPLHLWATSTPAGRTHWLFKYWFPDEYFQENPDVQLVELDTDFVPAFREFGGKSADNPYGGKIVDANLARE